MGAALVTLPLHPSMQGIPKLVEELNLAKKQGRALPGWSRLIYRL